MDSRDRVLAALNHKEADRVPLTDGPWFTTIERWHNEGLPKDVSPEDFFGFEMAGFGIDSSFQIPEKIIEETDDYIIRINANGITEKNWKHKTSTPELIDFSLNTRKKWEELKGNLVFKKNRIPWELEKPRLEKSRKKGMYLMFAEGIGYDKFSSIVGPMNILPAMLEDPDWVADMFKTHTDLVLECAEEMFGLGYGFDGAFLFDDLGYKNGVFFSTNIYRNLLQPQHKRICDFFHGRGCKVILHSCGNVLAHIPALIEAGFDCLQPLEVKAGMDVVELKKQYGDVLAFMGGIDVRKMSAEDPNVIEEEIRTKISFAKKGGGYIYHSDHSVPDSVSFEQYKRVIELVKKYGTF